MRELEQVFRAEGVKAANNVVDLIALITPRTTHCTKAIHATRRILIALEKPEQVDETFSQWIQQRRKDYILALLSVLGAEQSEEEEVEAAVAAAVLTHAIVWKAILCGLLKGEVKGEIVEGVVGDFVQRFADLRVGALELVKERTGELQRRLWILRYCGVGTEENVARGKEKMAAKEIRRLFGGAWMATLEDTAMDSRQKKEVLTRMSEEIIPNMADPLKLADFLSDAYDDWRDVGVRVAALDGLFVLISKYRLDYPLFYQKLYAMMQVQVLFYEQERKKFLELVAMVLKRGGMLPGGLIAAFVKRLVRRALMAPAEGALWCLRLALDLLYKHPNVSYLVHRAVNLFEETDGNAHVGDKRKREDAGMDDPFDDDELDPQASRADESSLWELEVLAKHVSPAVSRLVTLFSKDVRDKKQAPPPGSLDDYVDLKFEDTFNAEFKRKAKSSHLAYNKPGCAPGLKELQKKLDSCIEWT